MNCNRNKPAPKNRHLCTFLALLLFLPASQINADQRSARQAMENQDNPLLLLSSSQGPIYIELLPDEAPQNVQRFLDLAAGDVEFTDPVANTSFTPRYYDGMRFHRVLPGQVIQAGSPHYHPLGSPDEMLEDEINAFSLGLDRLPILAEDGSVNPVLNVGSQADFAERVLSHVYSDMNIDDVEELESRQSEVVQNLRGLTVMRLYEQEGYGYQNEFPTRGITRGIVALANDGPDRNGPEFFISLDDAAWLSGRYTVIGRVVEGMDVADQIGNTAIDAEAFDPQSTMIYSMRRLN